MLAKTLETGSIVDLVAPAGPFDRARFEEGVGWLRTFGLVPRFDESILSRTGYLAGDDARRLSELTRAIEAPDSQAIWCVRGGFGCTRLLPGLDVAAVRRANKLLIGFSDVTALHAVWNLAGVASVHGSMVARLAIEPELQRNRLFDLVLGKAGDDRLMGEGVLGGAVSGPLGGGNLALLAALCGTPWQPRFEASIVFLEDVGERPYRLDRMLTQCTQAGLFTGIRGLVFGDFTDCDEADGSSTARGVLHDFARRLGVPAIEGIHAGHGAVNDPLPFGITARIDGSTGTLAFEGHVTRSAGSVA